jgi:hypothetical protein
MVLSKAVGGVTILLLLSNQNFCAASTVTSITPDDVAVFHAILSSVCRKADPNYSVVSDIPVSAWGDAPTWPATSLWTKLASRVPSGVRWPHLNVCPGDRVVDGKKIDLAFSRQTAIPPRWEPFYAAFHAKGLLRLSIPAFTPDGARAVVYLEAVCGSLCGSGFYIELTRRKADWKISRRETAWIS